MQGLNKLFMDDPRAFLATHSLRVRGRKDQYSPFAGLNHNLQPPIFQFDIICPAREDPQARDAKTNHRVLA
jgi:hypothetical protein